MFPRSNRLLAILCVLACAGCGRGTDYDLMLRRLQQGELEEVERVLAGDDGTRARALLALATRMRENRIEVRERIDRLREERDGLTSKEVLQSLWRLAENQRDRVILDWIEAELSAALEWAAARTPEFDGELLPIPGKPYEEPREGRAELPAEPLFASVAETEPVRAAALARVQSPEATRLARELESARPAQRDALYAELRALGARDPLARATWRGAVSARVERAIAELSRSASMRGLTSLLEQRRALDAARRHALELVFDEERFFYPYTLPHVESKRAIQYPKVRAEVMERVAAVREIWNGEARATLSRSARDALEEVAWFRTHASELELDHDPCAGVDEWILAQDPALETLGVREIALDFADARALARDREILARNEALWVQAISEGATSPSDLEREQVRVTNEYRRLMGRRVLAWDPRLQEAARRHSEYMDRTGDFGHEESVPELATTALRLRAVGYEQGLAENCYEGFFGPAAVHAGWLSSSDHHRNILAEPATEMASGYAGNYWTQLLGEGRTFEQDIEARPGK